MATLITGGSSQIDIALAKLLWADGRQLLIASRSGNVPSRFDSVKFDWYDLTTFENPFSSERPIESVYILPPTLDIHPDKSVVPFIDVAIAKDVKRFVLLSASGTHKSLVEHGVGLAFIHKYLEDKGANHFIVKPTWFIGELDVLSSGV